MDVEAVIKEVDVRLEEVGLETYSELLEELDRLELELEMYDSRNRTGE
jgi:hypothetical protein